VGEAERRVGLNEAVFREVNERLRDLNQSFTSITDRMDLICECADAACTAHVGMTPAEYELLRSDARRFVVLPGHEVAGVELVLERHDGYFVVEKTGDAAQAAEDSDPRQPA
jgi:hypothetical protein